MDEFSSFKTGWFILGNLPGYRVESPGCAPASYEHLPPLDEQRLDGSFHWLDPTRNGRPSASAEERQALTDLGSPPAHVSELVSSAEQLGLTLPEPFLTFMASPVLQEAIFACSCCWVDPAARIVPCPGHPEGYIIRFLNDQQDCLFWYLYVSATTGEQCVLVSWERLDPEEEDDDTGSDTGSDREDDECGHGADAILLCAPTFEVFLYRFWWESRLSRKLTWSLSAPLTSEEQQYLAHYTLPAGD